MCSITSVSGIHSNVQPAISSNPLGIETQFQLSTDIPTEMRSELVRIIGEYVSDYRFWIPEVKVRESRANTDLVRRIASTETHLLQTHGSPIRRLRFLQQLLSIGFVLNTMYIPELHLTKDVVVSIACHLEPFNFHPRLLSDGNQVDSCLVTFTYTGGALNGSVQLMIISVICRLCGFSRM